MKQVYSVTIGGANDCVVMTESEASMIALKFSHLSTFEMYDMTKRHGMKPEHLHKLARAAVGWQYLGRVPTDQFSFCFHYFLQAWLVFIYVAFMFLVFSVIFFSFPEFPLFFHYVLQICLVPLYFSFMFLACPVIFFSFPLCSFAFPLFSSSLLSPPLVSLYDSCIYCKFL